MAECIDKEAFKKSVEERYCKPCKAEGKDHNGCWCRACWVDDMLDEVDCFQPADVAPVVHGRWIEREDPMLDTYYTCSACNEDFYIEQTGDPVKDLFTYTYCPSCGAKMDIKDGGDNDAKSM